MTHRIGVFICECGPNIRDAIDITALTEFCKSLPEVVIARKSGLLCSAAEQELLRQDIVSLSLTHVVIAGCSPKEHEPTFQHVLDTAGLNPFLLQIANIREHCAWVTPDKTQATEKAKIQIQAAVRRVRLNTPLSTREISCNPHILVIGAGVSGMTAAMAAADAHRRVYLIEKAPCIGGRVSRFETVFPGGECATCMLDPLMDAVLHHEYITLYTQSELVDVKGFYGNFTVRVRRHPRYVSPDACIGCAACCDVCPVTVPDEFNEGLDTRNAIYIPYPGALPHIASIDAQHCLHLSGDDCSACGNACAFGAIDMDMAEHVEEFAVGGIILSTGCDLLDISPIDRYGYGNIPNVYTAMEFERIVSSTGPTGGRLLLKNGEAPRYLALIHCAGSRTSTAKPYCSSICCRYLLKFARMASEKLPDIFILILFSDWCLPEKNAQKLLASVLELPHVQCQRLATPDSLEIFQKNDAMGIRWQDIHHKVQQAPCDMAVLAPALTGSADAFRLSDCLNVPVDSDGFFSKAHPMVSPVSTSQKGIWMSGSACSPCTVPEAVAQGLAAAGIALSGLSPERTLQLPACISEVDSAMCSGCGICLGVCPHQAIILQESCAVVQDALCQGCGSCAAACPSSAITARHFTDGQIEAEISGLLDTSAEISPDRLTALPPAASLPCKYR